MNFQKMLNIMVLLFVLCSISTAQMCGRINAVSAGEDHSLALAYDGSLMACGSNGIYQLGIGDDTSNQLTLQRVKGINGTGFLTGVNIFDAGWYHSLAVSNGILVSWGTNSKGQLGNISIGNGYYASTPIKVKGIGGTGFLSDTKQIVALSAGRSGEHSLVVDSNGYVYAFGFNNFGQCGDNSTTDRQYPVQVVSETGSGLLGGPSAKIVAVEAAAHHSLALSSSTAGGYVYEWGENNGSLYPVKVPNYSNGSGAYLRNIKGISSCYHSVAVDSNGFVYEWDKYNLTPAKVLGENGQGFLSNIKMVAAGAGSVGGAYSIALSNDGQVWYWTLGNLPERVSCGDMQTTSGYLENITAIAAGFYNHHLAIDNQGRGWAWGSDNGAGRFGVGDTDSHITPVQVVCPQISATPYITKTYTIEGVEPNCAKPFIGYGIDDNYLKFTISYGNPTTNPLDPNYMGTLQDVNIIDMLPYEVNFDSVTGGATYDAENHRVVLHLGTLASGATGSFVITTTVNEYARPGSEITNYAELSADKYYAMVEANVPVCNWGGEIIYVDKDANGFENGTNWYDAYTDLQTALAAAENLGSGITAIWVAAGTYKPVDSTSVSNYQNISFELSDNLALIGHFGGNEGSTEERDLSNIANETILDGKIGANSYESVYKVINATNINNGVIDGFRITGGSDTSGIYMDGSEYLAIVNCKFKNSQWGIYATTYSWPDVFNCTFFNHTQGGVYAENYSQPLLAYCTFDGNEIGYYGVSSSSCSITAQNSLFKNYNSNAIYCYSSGSFTMTDSQVVNNQTGFELSDITTDLTGCKVKNNSGNGLSANSSNVSLKHCLFEGNNEFGISMSSGCDLSCERSIVRYNGYHGFSLSNNFITTIKNSWIHKNGIAEYSIYYGGAGIYLAGSSQTPMIRNNTIYDNNTYGIAANRYGAEPNVLNCIIYSNDANDFWRETGGSAFSKVKYSCLQTSRSGAGNFVANPLFTLNDVNDLHIDGDSPCVDAGDPCGIYTDEIDIDDEPRNASRIDIGADENFYSKADYNEDGVVNFVDYATFAASWQLNNAPQISLDGDNDIDNIDLLRFCNDWLWQSGDLLGWLNDMNTEDAGSSLQMQSMAMMTMLGDENMSIAMDYDEVSSVSSDSLMLADLQASKVKRPDRLAKRTDAFYAITPQSVAAWKAKTDEITSRIAGINENAVESISAEIPVDIDSLVDWLDEVWLSGELSDAMTEEEYLEFKETIEQSSNTGISENQ